MKLSELYHATYTIQIIENAAGLPCPDAGRYVNGFDPYFNVDGLGLGFLKTTIDRSQALQFKTNRDAFEFWQQVSPIVPMRDDGKPNRPLTAYTVSIEAYKP